MAIPRFRSSLFFLPALLFLFWFADRLSAQDSPAAKNFDTLAKEADAARAGDRVDDAVSLYREALELKPEWTEGWWSLGTLEYDSNMYGNAANAFRRVVALKPDHGSGWVMLGLCQFELGDDDGALENLQKGRALGVTNQAQLYNVAAYHVGLLQLRKKLFASALKTFEKLAQNDVHTDEVALGIGMALLMLQPSALPDENTPGRAVIVGIGRADFLAVAKKFDEAQKSYSSLLRQYPDYPGLHFVYGLFMAISEPDEAIKQIQAELRINPNSVIALSEMAALLLNDNPPQAVQFAKKAVALNPHPPFGHYLLGQCYLKAGDAAAAVPELELARSTMRNEPEIYFALGNAYAKLGKKNEAAQARAEFLRLQQSQAEANGAAPPGQGEETQIVLPEKALDH